MELMVLHTSYTEWLHEEFLSELHNEINQLKGKYKQTKAAQGQVQAQAAQRASSRKASTNKHKQHKSKKIPTGEKLT